MRLSSSRLKSAPSVQLPKRVPRELQESAREPKEPQKTSRRPKKLQGSPTGIKTTPRDPHESLKKSQESPRRAKAREHQECPERGQESLQKKTRELDAQPKRAQDRLKRALKVSQRSPREPKRTLAEQRGASSCVVQYVTVQRGFERFIV